MNAMPSVKSHVGKWVQTEREAHEAWSKLIAKSPKAAQLMHLLTARMGPHNAVVISQPTLAELMDCHVNTVAKSVKLLQADNWIEVRRIGGSGTTNAHIVNDRVAWSGKRDGIRYSLFSAVVVVSSNEQPDRDQLGQQEPLRRRPRVGEVRPPEGAAFPPRMEPQENEDSSGEDNNSNEWLAWHREQRGENPGS